MSSIFGCAYLQGGSKGVASYHFVSPEDCYISYASAPSSWRLEDGSAPPARKQFQMPSYEPETRTFRGTIDWGDNPFGGSARWEYEMNFSAEFDAITDGAVRFFQLDGSEKDPVPFGVGGRRRLVYERVVDGREELLALLLSEREAE